MLRATCFTLAALMPLPVAAHPHVFVQAGVSVVFSDGQPPQIALRWEYDELFSLLVTSDLGLDMDGDLVLTAQEQDLLEREIAAWPPDFAGDLEVLQGQTPLPLAPKQDHQMQYQAGIFVEQHIRPLQDALIGPDDLMIRVYDPYFYTAYDLTGPVTIEGREDCTAEIERADLDAAYALAARMGATVGGADTGDVYDFPQIGHAFADTIVVTCAGPW